MKFQYNKTALQDLNKQLRIRQNALPILKSKETALRVEVKKSKNEAEKMEQLLKEKLARQTGMIRLWEEFDPALIRIKQVHLQTDKIAGVSIPVLTHIDFEEAAFSLYNRPSWFPAGRELIKEWMDLMIRKNFLIRKMVLLDRARKKTTQKVNLYEKVQIPAYEDAIIKIKRFLEDEENLAKSAQKIVKNRQQANRKAL